jgi:tRNA-uridine 2-sulfurtransferase
MSFPLGRTDAMLRDDLCGPALVRGCPDFRVNENGTVPLTASNTGVVPFDTEFRAVSLIPDPFLMSRVILAMSGGVDSSVAAWLLREQGHDVVGVFMRHGQDATPSPPTPLPKGEGTSCSPPSPLPKGEGSACSLPSPAPNPPPPVTCCTAADAADARRVADRLDIPFYALDFHREFDRIVDYFVADYVAGRTPNPCIVCNTWLKFGRLFEYADRLGADCVATGHYARLVRDFPDSRVNENGTVPFAASQIALCRGRDESKDQSYVLFGVRRELLPRLMFPLGEHCKEEIRGMARQLGFPVAAKRDSQEICFVPDRDHARFIRQYCPHLDTSGDIVTTDGVVVGRHDGFERFTIGQRKGLGVAFGEPRYVVRIEPATHRVVLGTHDELARTELTAAGANWLVGASMRCDEERERGRLGDWETKKPNGLTEKSPPLPPSPSPPLSSTFRATVKIRYRSRAMPALVQLLPDNRFHVQFDKPCHAIAPGQAAVCYDGDRVLGGGWIE